VKIIFTLFPVIRHYQRTKAWSDGGKTVSRVGRHDRTATRVVGRGVRVFGGKRFCRIPRRGQCPFR